MAVDVLLGLQWGDEGKGKIVDYLSTKYDVVARFQGGPNAGHTLEFEGIKHVLHQVPSGVFHPHILNIIGNGVVLDPIIFKKEALGLIKYNIDLTKNLVISKRAQIILPTHKLLDKAYEESKGDKKIGSTLKGIGPSYQDKIGRLGLRVGDLVAKDFKQQYQELANHHKEILDFYGADYTDLPNMEQEFFDGVEFLKTFKSDNTEYLINQAIDEGKNILAEGAQGSLLDIDYGTYPFVTSSNTTVAGACTGLGVSPKNISKVFGIFKAYCTRVGSGPFPSELDDEVGQELRDIGREYGSTTGRPRRCGWIDLPALRYAVMLSGVTELYMMKTDVLNAFETIKACVGYELKSGESVDELPYNLYDIKQPIYEEVKGWNQNLQVVDTFDKFPSELNDYISFLETKIGIPINLVSIGPDRTETIMKNNVLV